jgi:hypothetical protein
MRRLIRRARGHSTLGPFCVACGIKTADEVKQLAQDLTQAKFVEMSIGSSERSLDQRVKVTPTPFSAINRRPSAAISLNRNSFGVRRRRKCKQYWDFWQALE